MNKILYLVFNLPDQPNEDFFQEYQLLMAQIQRDFNNYSVVDKFAVNTDILHEALFSAKIMPNIIHFAGYNLIQQPSQIRILNSANERITLGSETLISTFENVVRINNRLDTVIINVGYSEELATGILKYVPNVIGINPVLNYLTIKSFTTGFYRGIVDGHSTENSFRSSVINIALQGWEKDNAVMFIRDQTNIKKLFVDNGFIKETILKKKHKTHINNN